MIKVALVDSHPLVGMGLEALIEEEIDLKFSGSAQCIAAAIKLIRRDPPDVIISEIGLGESNIFQLIEKVRMETERTKFVIFSWQHDRVYLKRAMQLDINAYVLKTSDTSVLLHAVRWAYSGGIYIDPSFLVLAAGARAGRGDGSDLAEALDNPLSDRESATLRLIALGYSNKEVARSLGVSPKSVETYKARAITKTGLFSRAKIVRYAMINGWFDRDDEAERVPQIISGRRDELTQLTR